MRRGGVTFLVVLFLVGGAYASPTLFTFDDGGLSLWQSDIAVSRYMSETMGSAIMTNGAYVSQGDGFGDDMYLTTRCQLVQPGDICIISAEPVSCVEFDGFVFDATTGPDFQFKAYDICGNLVIEESWNAGEGGFSYSSGLLSTPVYTLQFSDHGIHDVGIDDLMLCTDDANMSCIPVPGSIVLASIGMIAVGWLRRLRTL